MKFSDYKGHYISLIKLGAPILVGQLGMIVVAFADNIMVGRYSTEALASASFVNNVFNLAMFACLGFTYGLTPLIGAMFTQERYGKIGAIIRNGILANFIFALVITLIMGALWFNLHRLGQPEELLPLIRPYYLLVLAGIIPVALFNVFAQWLFAINNTSLPMWIILAANTVNILGNYLLIYGNCGFPELGLIGAGVSTLTSRILCLATVILIFIFSRRFRQYRDGFTQSRLNRRTLSQINRTSFPVSLQMSLESGSFTFAAVMAGWLGAVSLASFQIIVITGTLGFCVYYSLGSAVSVLVSNRAGLSDNDGMRRVAFAGYHIMLTLATISSLIFIFFEKDMILAFTEDPEVIAATMTLIVPLVLYQLGDATQINFANALRGTSNVMPMIWIAFVCYVVVGIPATYMLGFPAGLGTFGIILSFSASLFLAAGLFLYFFLKSTRKKA
ncbi:MATE family efflux transporter [uncultured Muribaculum sp.]|uniref:MATE family efflux transporter n=1 Tax=uncultured Muribaculum sp. TaxID=1918613 RepID=UPI0025987CAD|nr:MATE family efflux transporter [uncultured Muribaculum sp.]